MNVFAFVRDIRLAFLGRFYRLRLGGSGNIGRFRVIFEQLCTTEIKAHGIPRANNGIMLRVLDLKAAFVVFKELCVPQIINGRVPLKAELPRGIIGIRKVHERHFRLICISIVACYIIVYIIIIRYVNPFCAIKYILRIFKFLARQYVTESDGLVGRDLGIVVCSL